MVSVPFSNAMHYGDDLRKKNPGLRKKNGLSHGKMEHHQEHHHA
jgi:hypothetical protein